jgi:hypothetical protein
MGTSEESKAYRLYDPLTKKIIINRDVIFDESSKWDWEKGKEAEIEIEDVESNDDNQERNDDSAETPQQHTVPISQQPAGDVPSSSRSQGQTSTASAELEVIHESSDQENLDA